MAQQTYGEWMRSNPPIPNLTAVEWLKDTLKCNYGDPDMLFISWKSFNDLFKQAKQIEKEQINKAFYDGYYEERLYDARNYYTDTYSK